MLIGISKITAQSQTSVPLGVREKLGVGPGALLEWEERNGEVVVRRAAKYSFEDVHLALFPEGPPKLRSLQEMKEGVRSRMRKR